VQRPLLRGFRAQLLLARREVAAADAFPAGGIVVRALTGAEAAADADALALGRFLAETFALPLGRLDRIALHEVAVALRVGFLFHAGTTEYRLRGARSLEDMGANVAAMSEAENGTNALRLATEARDRVHFEEDALALSDQVYRVARHLSGSREDAEELVQETYARAFRSWRSFQPGTNLRAWLLRILTNLNIDRGRRRQRAPETQPLEEGDYFLYNRLEESTGDGTADEERVVERLSQDDIVTALSAVPHDFRDVIVLVDIGDFSYQDAAQILDIPVGTVMSRLHRGRRILKRELAETTVGEEQ
jgi:RNA polymerase sigma-70 factor, ECF subfamily